MFTEKLLKQRSDSLKPQFDNLECHNAHAGINDAITYMPLANSAYQPDYHNRRRQFPEIKLLNSSLRFCMKSEIGSLLIYFIKFRSYVEEGTMERNLFFNFDNKNQWLTFGNDSMFSANYNAFYNNNKNLISVALANKQKVVLVTEVVNKPAILGSKGIADSLLKILDKGFERNKYFLELLSSEMDVTVCKLKSEDFPPAMFMEDDPIHVNETGEALKARFVSLSILKAMRKGLTNSVLH